MLKEHVPGPRMSSNLVCLDYMEFADPALATSLMSPSKVEKYSAKRWTKVAVEPEATFEPSTESQSLVDKKEPA